ncbi:ATP-binding domain-containing protein [Rhodococcus hoagii]|nr:ATP-binding domain-containing protein [Prescottella equi]
MLVSTIHQAKGLEWDNVAVVGAHDLLTRVGSRQPECELLYVALSRARDKIVVVDEWRPSYMKSTRTSGVSYQPKPGSNLADAISVTPDCLVSDRMVGGSEGQTILASLDEDALAEFELLASGHADWPTYRCSVAGSAVGVTTPQFGRTLASLPGIRNGAWPQLAPVCIDGVESRWATVDGTSFWLKPRPFGMASIQRKV